MKKSNTCARTALVAMFCMAFISLAQAQGKGRLKAEFNEELTPLQSAIADSVAERKGNGKAYPVLTLKCANPNSNNPKCQTLDEPCLDCGEITNRHGMVVGRKNRSETIINYASPAQRKDSAVKFDRIKVGSRNSAGMGAGPDTPWESLTMPMGRAELKNFSVRDAAAAMGERAGEMSLAQVKMRRGRSGLSEPVNNDLDCIDTVTRKWAKEDGCFEDGVLLTTMEELFEGDSAGGFVGTGCEHMATGEVFSEDPDDGNEGICYDEFGTFKGTSLEELIDEDGPDFAAQIDQDGDGYFDEDPSESGDIIASCRALYEGESLVFDEAMDMVDDQCDLSRAFMVKFNRKLAAHPENADGDLAYLVDDQGWPIDEETAKEARYHNARAYGEHARRVNIREDFSIKCKGSEELLDGECVSRLSNDSLVQFAFSKAMAAETESFDRDQQTPVLMGFTFAPPVIKWGHTVKEEVCADVPLVGEVCAEVFYARIGYEFDIAAGLRLPLQVELTELPPASAPGVLAESMPVIRTSLEPTDFTVGQFKDICINNNLSTDCTRFAFPEFIDSFNPDKSPNEKDGSELVGRETIFAGVKVRVLTIPVVDWAVDSDVDIIAMCSMLQVKEVIEAGDPLETQGATLLDVARIGTNLAQGDTTELLEKLKKYNCASFTTPYGYNGDKLRTLPFINESFDIGASCTTAIANGEVINVNGKLYPFCTGLEMGVAGAKVGIGLGIEARLGSTRIDANWRVDGDAIPAGSSNKLIYNHNSDESAADVLDIQLEVDNFEGGEFKDTAKIELNDFVYYANTFNLRLTANLQFGGILFLIPDTPSFTLFDLVLTGDEAGVPIGQHSGMDPVIAEFFVDNYALTVDGKPADSDPARMDDDTLLIKPGEAGIYQVRINNRGSVVGDFDNFRVAMSNQPDQVMPYTFVINPNTDLDCVDGDNNHFFGNPYDGVGDDCYTVGGSVRNDRTELIDEDGPCPEGQSCVNRDNDGDGLADEDPVDNWQAGFDGNLIEGVDAYQGSNEFLSLSVTPFRHPLTRPGIYPVQILADSLGATVLSLDAVDPVGQTRVDAEDVVLIKVDSFYEPLIAAQPLVESGKPGIGKAYNVEISNGSNVDDSIEVDTRLVDFNLLECTLTTLGSFDGCPFRATPTAIALAWTNGELPTTVGPLAPLEMFSRQFTVNVPSDWAGMEDTTYQLMFTVTSTGDPEEPPASNKVVVEQTVIATMESMTRYIGLELLELTAALEKAKADGIATAGLKPISVQAVQRTNDRALISILSGKLDAASRSHAANIRIMEAFTRALAGSAKRLPADLIEDLNARAAAIIADMTKAQANPIPSA